MASLTPTLLYIGNGNGNVYTVGNANGTYSIIKAINVCNTGTSGKSFSLNLVAAGENLGSQNSIVSNVALSAGNVFSYDTSIVMPAGSFLQITQADTSLTFTISGVEYVV